MPMFRVYPHMTVSTSVDVEAVDAADAVEVALAQGLPQLMFLDHTYPDEGDWDADESDVDPLAAEASE